MLTDTLQHTRKNTPSAIKRGTNTAVDSLNRSMIIDHTHKEYTERVEVMATNSLQHTRREHTHDYQEEQTQLLMTTLKRIEEAMATNTLQAPIHLQGTHPRLSRGTTLQGTHPQLLTLIPSNTPSRTTPMTIKRNKHSCC